MLFPEGLKLNVRQIITQMLHSLIIFRIFIKFTMKETAFSFAPPKDQLDEIERWLIEEDNLTGEGFYCNWEIIASSFDKKNIATISEDNNPIGFITWRTNSSFTSIIEIAEIKPNYRKKGLGKQLVSKLIEKLVSEDICVISLQCAPSSSEPIWRQLGFIDFPKNKDIWNRSNVELYKIVVPQLESQNSNNSDEFVELWDDEPYCTNESNSTWKWKLIFKEGTKELERPIIHPCHYDWRIKWSINNVKIKDDKVKYFDMGEIMFGKFLIIKNMPNIG